jgi:hypothetical protein
MYFFNDDSRAPSPLRSDIEMGYVVGYIGEGVCGNFLKTQNFDVLNLDPRLGRRKKIYINIRSTISILY